MAPRPTVSIDGDRFQLDGEFLYPRRIWRGIRIEGLLLNARLVQGIFDDLNPETRHFWDYPDGPWDPERNTREFVAALPVWRAHGLIGFTINLQGGSPQGYSQQQPWHNSAFDSQGELREAYLARLKQVLDRAEALGMIPIVGLFYFGQDQRLADEAAVLRGVDNALAWLFDQGYRNVLIEVNNECNVRYDHAILRPERVHELIERVTQSSRDGRRFLAGTSYGGGTIPKPNVVAASDYLLLHGNGVGDPNRIREMVRRTREVPGYRGQPIVFNEDDHFDFDQPDNNFIAAVSEGAGWGYFDFRMTDEGYEQGFQSVPVDWRIGSERKRGFFGLLAEMTGAPGHVGD